MAERHEDTEHIRVRFVVRLKCRSFVCNRWRAVVTPFLLSFPPTRHLCEWVRSSLCAESRRSLAGGRQDNFKKDYKSLVKGDCFVWCDFVDPKATFYQEVTDQDQASHANSCRGCAAEESVFPLRCTRT